MVIGAHVDREPVHSAVVNILVFISLVALLVLVLPYHSKWLYLVWAICL